MTSEAASSRDGAQEMTVPKTAQILIVDDSPANILALRGMLADEYAMHFATSGREALETAARQPAPDLILLDLVMPELDGYAVCAALKADAATRDIPVIFVTARADPDSESRALAAGGVDFIHKPVDATVLRARVGVHLTLRRQAQALARANAELSRQAAALSAANAELARHRDHLEDRVHERTRELAAALDAAQSGSRAKSAFLGIMGHELRTPINHIVGLAYLLARPGQGARAQTYPARIQQSARELLALINNVLDYSASESETLRIASVDFDPVRVCDRAADAVRAGAQAKGIELVREVDPGLPPWLQGDPRRLGQVLDQLLDNAVKFSQTGPIRLRIRLAATHGGAATLRYEVEDRGIGIAPEQEVALFELFEQGDSSLTRRFGGTGLGLALCRRLVSLMGGELGLTSTPGQGSTFWFAVRLPLGQAPAARLSDPHGIDWPQRVATVAALDRLLADADRSALLLWEEVEPELTSVLGARAQDFRQAIEGLEMQGALRLLREAAAATPELSGSR